jgi:hypothetical protein
MSEGRGASLFFLCFGLFWLISGLRAVVTRQAVSRPKAGRAIRVFGRDAVWHGVIAILVGVAVLIFDVANWV